MEINEKVLQWKDEHSYLDLRIRNKKVPIYNFRDVCYHYTPLESFWKIIESDTFRATHVRFSNDDEEYTQGRNIIRKIVDSGQTKPTDCYVICFCHEPNILSQWREYAQIGVSIGMDFSRTQYFSILQNNWSKEILKLTAEKHQIIPSVPIDVLYSKCKCASSRDHEVCPRNCSQRSPDKYNFINGEDQHFTFRHLKKLYDTNKREGGYELNSKYLSLVPYIKHADFKEEKEARLIFELSSANEHKYVEYLDVDHLKRPYCNVKSGDVDDFETDCAFVEFGKGVDDGVRTAVINELILSYPSMCLENPITYPPQDKNIYISAGKNQYEIFQLIDKVVNQINSDQKVWCNGHWPIRSVLVGPTAYNEHIAESIQQYVDNHYWLKHIDVRYTSTPYREKK